MEALYPCADDQGDSQTGSSAMSTTPLSHQLGRRLEEIDRQISTCLTDIRRNLAELERVSQRGDAPRTDGRLGGQSDGRFADALDKAMKRGGGTGVGGTR